MDGESGVLLGPDLVGPAKVAGFFIAWTARLVTPVSSGDGVLAHHLLHQPDKLVGVEVKQSS
jgi:hypothetical protein